MAIIKKCLVCNKEFSVFPSTLKYSDRNGRFCSKSCARTGKYNPRYNGGLKLIKKKCQFCGKEFMITLRISKLRPAKYCSRKCVNNSQKTGKSNKIMGGYKYIYSPNHPNCNCDGYVVEHRLIMEENINRYLTKLEIVHHKDHNSLNNKFENLMVLGSSGEHSRLHRKINPFTDKRNPNYKHGKFVGQWEKYYKNKHGRGINNAI